MNKIDLIIDALSIAQNSVWSKLNEEALAAAHDLKATYPQGAKVRPAEFVAAATIGSNVNFVGTPMIWAEWPTRSEVAMSPEHLPQYIATNNIKPTTEGGGGAGGKLAKPEQEPVGQFVGGIPEVSQQREWVGLTDDDVSWADGHSHGNTTWTKQKAFSRAIEAKLKEKNHGSV